MYCIMKKLLRLFGYIKNLVYSKIAPVSYARSIGVKVDSGVKIFSLHPGAFGSEPYLVSIGCNVVVTAGVRFITHDGSTFLFRETYPDLDVMGPITIGDNTFIGMGSVILPGVSVGRNCVIGAMSVVSSPIPDGTVVAGNPARVLNTIDEFREKLLIRNCRTGNLNPDAKRARLVQLPHTKDSKGRSWLSHLE